MCMETAEEPTTQSDRAWLFKIFVGNNSKFSWLSDMEQPFSVPNLKFITVFVKDAAKPPLEQWTLSQGPIRWNAQIQMENICVLQSFQELFSNHWAKHRRMYKYICSANRSLFYYIFLFLPSISLSFFFFLLGTHSECKLSWLLFF